MALRQILDLYVCLRLVRYYAGTPSPVKQPELTDMVIFRENAEDIYAGIEWKAGSAEADKVIKFLQDEMGVTKSASRRIAVSVSSRALKKGQNAWSAQRLTTPLITTVIPSPWFIKATL